MQLPLGSRRSWAVHILLLLGAEGISSSMFLPSVPQKMQRARAGPGFWVEEAKYELSDRWKFLSGRSWHLPTWQQQKCRDTAWTSWRKAWEIWGEHPQPPVMFCHFCPPLLLWVPPVNWGAVAVLSTPAWHRAALGAPTCLWRALGKLRLLLCERLPGRCSEQGAASVAESCWGGWLPRSGSPPSCRLCGQELLEQQPRKAGANLILEG